ncbi:MAG: glycosyltransferase [Proteobacteria bacterium]|nr:glycosyltransferase [Pseudomonadota bacterium]
MPPDISVLMPVRDAAETLPLALASVLRQRGADFECLVVDDGSTDGSDALAAAWAANDPRIRALPGPRRGLVATLQRGLAACRGAFVARMDADD